MGELPDAPERPSPQALIGRCDACPTVGDRRRNAARSEDLVLGATAAREPMNAAFTASVGTMSCPSGHREIGISLKLATPSGMPMMVMQSKVPVKAWPIASQMPDRMSHKTSPMRATGRA